MRRIALFPCTSRIALAAQIALQHDPRWELHGIYTDRLVTPDADLRDKFDGLWSLKADVWCPRFERDMDILLDSLQPDALICCHDEALYRMKRTAGNFIPGPSWSAVEICRFKSRTYAHLGPALAVPQLVTRPPAFLKPDRGQGSHGCRMVIKRDEMQQFWTPGTLATEYISGAEFTVDCFTDRDDNLLCFPRQRLEVKNGVAIRSESVSDKALIEACQIIQSHLEMRGVWFAQFKRQSMTAPPVLMEVGCRLAGGSGHWLPVWNLMQMQLEEFCGIQST